MALWCARNPHSRPSTGKYPWTGPYPYCCFFCSLSLWACRQTGLKWFGRPQWWQILPLARQEFLLLQDLPPHPMHCWFVDCGLGCWCWLFIIVIFSSSLSICCSAPSCGAETALTAAMGFCTRLASVLTSSKVFGPCDSAICTLSCSGSSSICVCFSIL